MDDVEVGRRVAAARKRAGMDQRKTLTDAAEVPNVGPATLGKIERGQRHLFPHEADAFARILGVTPAFFFEEEATESQLDRIEAHLIANGQALEVLLGGLANDRATEQPALTRALDALVELRRYSEAQRKTA